MDPGSSILLIPFTALQASLINPAFSVSNLPSILSGLLIILVLLLCCACFAASENAFFSLSKAQIEEISKEENKKSEAIIYLLQHPKKLLATILIANNLAAVGIVMVSTYLFDIFFNFQAHPLTGFVFQVVLVTFIIVLLGEVMPKIFANQHSRRAAGWLAIPMVRVSQLLTPFVYVLVRSTAIIDKRITRKGHQVSVAELNHAIEITSEKDTPHEEKEILKNIVNFGDIEVNQIMKPRMDVATIEKDLPFSEVLKKIKHWGYSRLPVIDKSFDNIEGILYIKDFLPHLNQPDDFNWLGLLKSPLFVPENKKIDDLLEEFQTKRIHMAVVIDEYGGSKGIVTMEDIMEEIFGEIHDEYDEVDLSYSKIDNDTFVFEGKTTLNDMCRAMEIDADSFDETKGESESIAGLVLEKFGKLPNTGQEISINGYVFKIESVDKRKINRLKVSRPK